MIDAAPRKSGETPQVTPQVEALLEVLDTELSRVAIMGRLNLKDRNSFTKHYLQPALDAGLIEMERPDKPTSRLQRYRRCLR